MSQVLLDEKTHLILLELAARMGITPEEYLIQKIRAEAEEHQIGCDKVIICANCDAGCHSKTSDN